MTKPSAGITFRTIQEMMPEYTLPHDLLEDVVAALPPPPDGAPEAWRRARLDRLVEEIASRVPMNAAQASLAGEISIVQGLAHDVARQLQAPGLELRERCKLLRMVDALMHTVTRLERTLERRQVRMMPSRDVRPEDGADLVALDQAWCRGAVGERAEAAVGDAAVVPMVRGRKPEVVDRSMEVPGGKRELVMRDGQWCDREREGEREGDAAGTDDRGDEVARPVREAPLPPIVGPLRGPSPQGEGEKKGLKIPGRSREGVTVETGDGWTLETWPARAAVAR